MNSRIHMHTWSKQNKHQQWYRCVIESASKRERETTEWNSLKMHATLFVPSLTRPTFSRSLNFYFDRWRCRVFKLYFLAFLPPLLAVLVALNFHLFILARVFFHRCCFCCTLISCLTLCVCACKYSSHTSSDGLCNHWSFFFEYTKKNKIKGMKLIKWNETCEFKRLHYITTPNSEAHTAEQRQWIISCKKKRRNKTRK